MGVLSCVKWTEQKLNTQIRDSIENLDPTKISHYVVFNNYGNSCWLLANCDKRDIAVTKVAATNFCC